mgnify:CR=1 FL=1
MILLGNTIYALAIVMFILPNNMITGGTTGLGIAIHHYFGLPIHSFVLLFNTLMFLLGAAVLGMKFHLQHWSVPFIIRLFWECWSKCLHFRM